MKKSLLLPALILASATVHVNATLTPITEGFVPGTSISYNLDLTSGHLEPGDGFTIFDVGGYTGILSLPGNWALQSVDPLNNPWGIAPGGPDNSELPNLTFVYEGAVMHQEFGRTTFGPFVVGTVSTLLRIDDWTSRDHAITAVGGGFQLGAPHTDEIFVPAPVGVPENGSTLALLGLAFTAFASLRRRLNS